MEKLKCESCGGDLLVDDDKEYATCPYCGTKYKLNDDVNVNIKMDNVMKNAIDTRDVVAKRFSKIMIIPIVFFIIIFCTIVFMSIKSIRDFKEEEDKSRIEYEQKAKEQEEESKRYSFNFQFTGDNGTQDAFFLESTLDEMIQSNKTNDRLVTLVFEGKEVTDESEIIEIKHSLDGKYEVSFNYDDDGYIDKIIVDKND